MVCSFSLLCNKWQQTLQLKTTSVHYLTIFLAQKSGCRLSEHLLRISPGRNRGVGQGCNSHLGLRSFSMLTGSWQNSFPCSCHGQGHPFLASCWPETTINPQRPPNFLTTWMFAFFQASTSTSLTFFSPSRLPWGSLIKYKRNHRSHYPITICHKIKLN